MRRFTMLLTVVSAFAMTACSNNSAELERLRLRAANDSLNAVIAAQVARADESRRVEEAKAQATRDSLNYIRALEAARVEQARRIAQEQLQAEHDAIQNLDLSTRPSLIEGQVLVLRNSQARSVDFTLTCYTVYGSHKTLYVSVPARGLTEVGFQQGWDGNFRSGERCEMNHDEDIVRTFKIS